VPGNRVRAVGHPFDVDDEPITYLPSLSHRRSRARAHPARKDVPLPVIRGTPASHRRGRRRGRAMLLREGPL
jgi:hypothetical protein